MISFCNLKSQNCMISDLKQFANGTKTYSNLPITLTSSTQHSPVMPQNSSQMAINYGERIHMGHTS
jgi:hypothetical protein